MVPWSPSAQGGGVTRCGSPALGIGLVDLERLTLREVPHLGQDHKETFHNHSKSLHDYCLRNKSEL